MKTIEELNKDKPAGSILTVIEISGQNVRCVCDCGKEKITNYYSFNNGGTKSCGCLYSLPHNKFYPIIPQIRRCWLHMRDRCYNKEHKQYYCYGGRGVIMCDTWLNDYQSFLDWAILNGWAKGLQIDKDIKGNGLLYSPETCCFVTPKTNQNTKRGLLYFNYKGEKVNLSQLSEITGIDRSTLKVRMSLGMSAEESALMPIKERMASNKVMYNGRKVYLSKICKTEGVIYGKALYLSATSNMSVEEIICKLKVA